MRWGVKELSGRAGLEQTAGVHDSDLVADLAHDGEVVADEDDGQPEAMPQVVEQLKNLGLHGDIDRRRRLVTEQHGRLGGERHGDQHALAHPARQLVRIGLRPALGLGQADEGHQFDGTLATCPAGLTKDTARHLGDLRTDGVHRVEGAERVLEDHRNPTASGAVDVAAAEGQRDATELSASRLDVHPRWKQTHHCPQRQALARARLADDAERSAAVDLKADLVDDPESSPATLDADRQFRHNERALTRFVATYGAGTARAGRDSRPHRTAHCGRRMSASPSPSKERPSPVITTARPGNVASAQCVVMNCCPSPIIDPQSGVGGCTPRPR